MLNKSTILPWCLNKTIKPNPKVRLVTFPYAGGGASIYRKWQSQFSSDIEVIPIQLPGRENRITENPYTSLKNLVDELFHSLEPLFSVPIAFFGHSMGALISYEFARLLQYSGRTPVHLFISAHSVPNNMPKDQEFNLNTDDEVAEKLRKLAFTPETILQNRELMDLLLPMIRADFSMVNTYEYSDGPLLKCPITVFGGTNDNTTDLNSLDDWALYTRNKFSKVIISGDHFFINNSILPITSHIDAVLNSFLESMSIPF